MVEHEDRLDTLLRIAPRRFHISENPPFGVGLVLCGHVNEDEDVEGEQFFRQHNGIQNCKPGIWASVERDTGRSVESCPVEYILYWVEPGTIDISQPVADWKAYEDTTRQLDERNVEDTLKHLYWKPHDTYYDDGGMCCIISTEYLTLDAAKRVQLGSVNAEGEIDFGSYLESLTLNCEENSVFTLGGINGKITNNDPTLQICD